MKPRNQGGLEPCVIPLLSDVNKDIAKDYGVLVDGADDVMRGAALRATFIIDDKGILRHSSINDESAGRNVEETLRILKALQFADKHGEVCPAKWKPGKATINPNDSKKLAEFWQNEHSK